MITTGNYSTSTGTGIGLKKKTDDKIIKEQQKTQYNGIYQQSGCFYYILG